MCLSSQQRKAKAVDVTTTNMSKTLREDTEMWLSFVINSSLSDYFVFPFSPCCRIPFLYFLPNNEIHLGFLCWDKIHIFIFDFKMSLGLYSINSLSNHHLHCHLGAGFLCLMFFWFIILWPDTYSIIVIIIGSGYRDISSKPEQDCLHFSSC